MGLSGDSIAASADGVGIAFTFSGDGPPVLMIHGFPDDRTLWKLPADIRTSMRSSTDCPGRGH